MKKSILIPIISLVFIFPFLNSSCQNSHAIENEKIDSLTSMLDQVAEDLSIDISMIEAREAAMEANRKRFLKAYKDTFTMELGLQIDRHKGIRKQYTKAIKEYKQYSLELSALTRQVTNLKKTYNKGKMTKDEFKLNYHQEASDVNALLFGTTALKRALYEIETEYYRLSDFMTAQLKMLGIES